jgi:hypothetical protein
MKDCRECYHSKPAYGRRLCLVLPNAPRDVEYMRRPECECGVEAALFDMKGSRRYAEFHDERP